MSCNVLPASWRHGWWIFTMPPCPIRASTNGNYCIYGQIRNRVCKNWHKNLTLVGKVMALLHGVCIMQFPCYHWTALNLCILLDFCNFECWPGTNVARFCAKKVYASSLWIINYANSNHPLNPGSQYDAGVAIEHWSWVSQEKVFFSLAIPDAKFFNNMIGWMLANTGDAMLT